MLITDFSQSNERVPKEKHSFFMIVISADFIVLGGRGIKITLQVSSQSM